MSEMSRREFVKNTAMIAAAGGFVAAGSQELRANPLGLPIGAQTWPVRQMIAKDFPATIKQLAAAGFQAIELCSPVGYAADDFAGLAKYSAADLLAGRVDGVALEALALRGMTVDAVQVGGGGEEPHRVHELLDGDAFQHL